MFVRRQMRLPDPLIDIQAVQDTSVQRVVGPWSTLATFVAFGAFVFIARSMQLVLGCRRGMRDWVKHHWRPAFVVGSMLTPMIARRVQT